MPDGTHGNTLRARVFSLIEILLQEANRPNQQGEERNTRESYHVIIEQNTHKLNVVTTVQALSELVKNHLEHLEPPPEKMWEKETAKVWRELSVTRHEERRELRRKDVESALDSLLAEDSPLLRYVENRNRNIIGNGKGNRNRKFCITLSPGNSVEKMAELENIWRLDGERSDESRLPPPVIREQITLKIGLASESYHPIYDVLCNLSEITSDLLSSNFPKIKFEPFTESVHSQAYKDFWEQKEPNKCDIIMLNDPWIPAFNHHKLIHPIEDTDSFTQFLARWGNIRKEKIFGEVFHSAFHQICVDCGKIVALPIIGNIQTLIVREDTEANITNLGFPRREIQLRQIEDIGALVLAAGRSGKYAINYRRDIKNAKVVVFWELLRLSGYEDLVKDGKVSINRNHADKALIYLDMLSPIDYKSLIDNLCSLNPPMLATIGWPSWNSSPERKLPGFDKIKARPLSAPVMGTWSLALPEKPKKLSLRELSAQVILLLTANKGIQSMLAQQGNPHVLRDLTVRDCFWNSNKENLEAIGRSKPLPRSIHWQEIEDLLGSQIEAGIIKGTSCFKNVPDLLEFTDDGEP
jgi:hypothetical protein